MKRIPLEIIGTVRNGRQSTADSGWGGLDSVIELAPEFADGLLGLDAFSHALVLFHMDRDPDDEPQRMARRPRGRDDMPLLGVFAQRARMRPNPVGITTVEIVAVEAGRLTVRGLDAIDGTPVLDIKPYVPAFDRREPARVPEWMDRLMVGYFDVEKVGPEHVTAEEVARRLRALLGKGGIGTGFPRKQRDRWILLHAAAQRFVPGESLSEIEATGRIGAFLLESAPHWSMDRASVRREMVDEGFLDRDADGRNYRVSSRHEARVRFGGRMEG